MIKSSSTTKTAAHAPIGGSGTNQYQIKGTPKVQPYTASPQTVQISEDLKNGLHLLVRDEEDYQKDLQEIPSFRRALTNGAAAEDLFRTGVAYSVMWALGKLIEELFGDND